MPKPKRKRPRGRPKSAEVKKYSKQIWFRVTPAQELAWRRAAKRAGIPFRTWLRMRIDEAEAMQRQRERGGLLQPITNEES